MKPLGLAVVILLAPWCQPSPSRADTQRVRVVIFTHVEDNTPGGILGSAQSQQSYLNLRARLIDMAALAQGDKIQWTLQPDWKLLEAALLYETPSLQATTNDKNVLRHLAEDRGVHIDPHSHENGGYNYTDVAHLLDSLGVGGSTVIGGHVWDPSLPQFAEWDRFRVPVPGEHYPAALWRGDILIGSGTPNHVNDPVISGLWRPRDRDHYFEDDPAGNITAIGQWRNNVASVQELVTLYRTGTVPPTAMLTFSININPATLMAPGGLAAVEDTVFAPINAWRDSGLVLDTDFTSLVDTWRTEFGAQSYVYDANAQTVSVPGAGAGSAPIELVAAAPNPARAKTTFQYTLSRDAHVRLVVYDIAGREVAVLDEGPRAAGAHTLRWDVSGIPAGVFACRLEASGAGSSVRVRNFVVIR